MIIPALRCSLLFQQQKNEFGNVGFKYTFSHSTIILFEKYNLFKVFLLQFYCIQHGFIYEVCFVFRLHFFPVPDLTFSYFFNSHSDFINAVKCFQLKKNQTLTLKTLLYGSRRCSAEFHLI